MADSDGENTSDFEPFVDTSNEEMQPDGTDATVNDSHVINTEGNCVVYACRDDDVKPSAFALNLNSCPPVSPHTNPGNAVAKYRPFGEIQAPTHFKRPETLMKLQASFIQKHAMKAQQHTSSGCGDPLPRQPRKHARRRLLI